MIKSFFDLVHVGVQARRIFAQPVAREQLAAACAARGQGHVRAREPLHPPAHLHERVEVVHALRHERDATAAQACEGRSVLRLAVVPDAAAHGGVRLVQAQDCLLYTSRCV